MNPASKCPISLKQHVPQKVYSALVSGLDPAWSQLTTEATFPVEAGTVMTVSCEEGFLLKGSNTITCTEGTTFSSTTTPTCVELGEFSVFKCTIDPRNNALRVREREKIARFVLTE